MIKKYVIVRHMAKIPALGMWRQEDQEFMPTLAKQLSLRSATAIWNLVSNNNKVKQNESKTTKLQKFVIKFLNKCYILGNRTGHFKVCTLGKCCWLKHFLLVFYPLHA